MSVPLLRLSDNFDTCISGEVNIHKSAVLAPGVILQAATNSKIIIGPGVCIGMGSILQVNEGILEVEAGVNLGAGFLMVGQGKIGANACIGAATTVFNCSVAAGQVVAPGSLLGDTSRQVEETQQIEPSTHNSTATKVGEEKQEEKVISSTHFSASAFVEFQHQSNTVSQPSPTPKSQSPPVEEQAQVAESHQEEPNTPESAEISNPEAAPGQAETEANNTFGTQIYGQGSINRLLITLFPHRQSLNDQHSDNSL
ncbi:transferase [Anabaena cylindrica FACHB-243]|uniref:Hexapeptide repeat-containing transferase n=1 Tax=Anabaena cylindrica (strain ATCC 27899 / PCC 7122) TaxID=272123 RepID=K9ZCH7_ANACC|nr:MULTISPECIES: hexapeptide repeat-containing transferase [Anabaena]AFZ56080.1 hexapeptide repeat-containing transferase [Anabaena cylindrica PCC 7122]MBD2419670.1 transferase [Anabaena cylindrica FACHB-243]MBY5281707.1 transferase [Anabaena sp. CCAP 1446/1C]MBY5311531.1 transferase [Anabaena sp. CCAP 1446/1C]MCM2408296.1 transferase [Anabaena sp. CCAP 1446/1C]